ncbi:MAG: IMPACT family protein [Luteibaculum sp.]
MSTSYRCITEFAEHLFKEKGSKFYAYAYPIKTEEEVKPLIEECRKKQPKANHHCFAYRIDPIEKKERCNDDGEPSGTAGKPILGQLHAADLVNNLIVVSRIFGGTKLGTGGLIAAYKTAAKELIENAQVSEIEIEKLFILNCPPEEAYKILGYAGQSNAVIKNLGFANGVTRLALQLALKHEQEFYNWMELYDNRTYKVEQARLI